MQTGTAEQFEVIADGFVFIEAPRVAPDGAVWFADLSGGGVYRRPAGGTVEAMAPDRQWVGGIVFDASGHALCSGRGGIVAIDPATGATRPVLSEIDGTPIIAVNDIEADGNGGLFGGTIDFVSILEKGETPEPGVLFHLSASGQVTVLRRDVFASNGIAHSPCGKWLYHSETSRGIWRYPIGPDGMPGAGELLIELEDSDGLVADRAGNLWVARWATGQLQQFSADGTPLQSLTFPYPHVVSLDFGANDPASIYVSTGGNADHPQAGAVLRVPVAEPGLPGGLTRLALLEHTA